MSVGVSFPCMPLNGERPLGDWVAGSISINDYKTMYPSFMESVWWAFKQLYDKGQVYRGFRVMPYSTGLTTPLSNSSRLSRIIRR